MARPAVIGFVAAAVLASALGALLPPRRERLEPAAARAAAGAFHVHSNRSDGSGSIDDIAAAARDAGLQFVIVTDHGDGTRPAEPPSYRSGVLTIDGVELSTSGGHYAVVGLRGVPYPLGGEARDVVDDVTRLGGFGVIAHGDSPRAELQWADWQAPVDGVEWMSLDSAWRRAGPIALARAFTTYWFRPAETLGRLVAAPQPAVEQFDLLARTRRIVSLASTDAHGPWVPSYAACFRTLTTRVDLDDPFTGDASLDAAALIAALRAGRHYTSIDAIASPPDFEFVATSDASDGEPIRQGGVAPAGAKVIFQVRAAGPAGAEIILYKDGQAVRRARAQSMIYQADGRQAVYRAEVRLAHSGALWLLSNPIYVGVPESAAAPKRHTATAALDASNPTDRRWRADHDPTSSAGVHPRSDDPAVVVFRYGLGQTTPYIQSVAMVAAVPPDLETFDRLTIEAEASGPMRVAVQLVRDEGGSWSRWQRSVYLDRTRRTVDVFFDELRPAPPTSSVLSLASIDALVFMVDTTNTRPGSSGEIIFNRVVYQR